MLKKLSSLAGLLALLAGTLATTGTAHAVCTFGEPSQTTHSENIISSQVFGSTFVLYGQNYGPWSDGGFDLSLAQRYDSSSVTTGVHGAAYTTELHSNGTYSSETTPFSDLQNQIIQLVFPKSGDKISALQVQVWFCD